MGTGSYPDDSTSMEVGSQEANHGSLHHHVFNLTHFPSGDNFILEADEIRHDSAEDYASAETPSLAPVDVTILENGGISTADPAATFNETDGFFTQSGSQEITGNYSEGGNLNMGLTAQMSAVNDSYLFNNYKTIEQTIDLKKESNLHPTSSYKEIFTDSKELIENFINSSELTTDSFVNLSKSPTLETISGFPFLHGNNTSSSHISEGYLVFPVNISDTFEKTHDSPTNDHFSNSHSNYSTPYDLNASFVYSSNFSSGDPTSFTFDLTSWFTLTPSNSADDWFDSPGHVEDETTLVSKVILLSLISLVGCLGNILVIWSVIKERHLHRPPFYFLLSFGVTDLSRAVFCVPVVITTVLHGSRWRHGESACKLFAFATSFFVFSSVLSLLAIAIDRHICVIYSKIYRRRAPGIANLVVAIIIWVIAFSISFPPVLGVGDYVFVPEEAQCAYQQKHFTVIDSISAVMIFVAILLVTYFLYFRIFRFLRGHRRMRPLQHTPALSSNWAFIGPGANGQAFINWLNGFGGQVPIRQGGQRSVQRLNFGRVVNLSICKNEHLTRLFLILTVVFGVTWLPYVILSVWRIFFDVSALPATFVTVSAWLGYGQVALCPCVYFIVRGAVQKPTRTVYSHAEKRSFLLENKARK